MRVLGWLVNHCQTQLRTYVSSKRSCCNNIRTGSVDFWAVHGYPMPRSLRREGCLGTCSQDCPAHYHAIICRLLLRTTPTLSKRGCRSGTWSVGIYNGVNMNRTHSHCLPTITYSVRTRSTAAPLLDDLMCLASECWFLHSDCPTSETWHPLVSFTSNPGF
jgi:hypothetical protein